MKGAVVVDLPGLFDFAVVLRCGVVSSVCCFGRVDFAVCGCVDVVDDVCVRCVVWFVALVVDHVCVRCVV